MSHRSLAASVLLALLLPLGACQRQASTPLPQGVQTVSGTLHAVPPSLKRRGSFLLSQGQTPLYYVESASINLTPLDGHAVTLQGPVEANTDPSAQPVLVVQNVSKGGEEPTRLWHLSGLGVSLKTPQSWHASIQQSKAQFTLSGSTFPVLTVSQQGATSLPFSIDSPPAGSPATREYATLLLGSRHALAVLDHTLAAYTVYVRGEKNADPLLTLAFDLSQSASGTEDMAPFLAVVHSLSIDTGNAQSSQSSVSDASSPDIGKPCGGPAGILCPAGLYCQITDTATNVGKCAKF